MVSTNFFRRYIPPPIRGYIQLAVILSWIPKGYISQSQIDKKLNEEIKMDLKECIQNLEVKERVEYTNIAEIGTFSIFDIKNIEVREFPDKDDPIKTYKKYLGTYGDKMVIIPLTVLEQIKIFSQNGFTNFSVSRTGSGLGTKYMVIPMQNI